MDTDDNNTDTGIVAQDKVRINRTVEGDLMSYFLADGHFYMDTAVLQQALAQSAENNYRPILEKAMAEDDGETVAMIYGAMQLMEHIGKFVMDSLFVAEMNLALTATPDE